MANSPLSPTNVVVYACVREREKELRSMFVARAVGQMRVWKALADECCVHGVGSETSLCQSRRGE